MSLTVITPPAVEPVTLAEAKNHLRVDITDDDSLIAELIIVARQRIEMETGRALITQDLRETVDGGVETIRLQRAPIQAITSVSVTGSDGTVTVLTSDQYVRDDGKLKYRFGAWPVGLGFQAIQVDYKAGYGDQAADVPGPIKEAIKQLVAHLYENREGQAEDAGLPLMVKTLIQPYKRYFSL